MKYEMVYTRWRDDDSYWVVTIRSEIPHKVLDVNKNRELIRLIKDEIRRTGVKQLEMDRYREIISGCVKKEFTEKIINLHFISPATLKTRTIPRLIQRHRKVSLVGIIVNEERKKDKNKYNYPLIDLKLRKSDLELFFQKDKYCHISILNCCNMIYLLDKLTE